MLKLTSSFSKKVPVVGADFSSQSYHAAVEVELPDGLSPEQLRQRIHETFDLVRQSVESELQGGNVASPAPVPATPTASTTPVPANQPRQQPASNNAKASARQLGFITDLALRRKLSPRALEPVVQSRFRVGTLSDLTRKQASEFIDHFDDITAELARAA